MAKNYFIGKSQPVANVQTVTVGGTLSSETFTISVGGIVIATHTDATTVIADTVSALVSAWNASTHPWALVVTAVDNSPDITLTADNAGVPFEITLNTPGGSATFVKATTTSSKGPNHYDDADNWSLEAVPVATNDVILANCDVHIYWGLDQNGVALASFTKNKSFVGKIGLDSRAFQKTAITAEPLAHEYREDYLKIDTPILSLGKADGYGTYTGSTRVKIQNVRTTATDTDLYGENSFKAEADLPVTRLLLNSTTGDVHIHGALGGVGIAVDSPGETSVVRDIYIGAIGSSESVQVSEGVTLTNWEQNGGVNFLNAAGTVTLIDAIDGTLETNGDFTVTTMNIASAAVIANHIKTAGSAITTLNMDGSSGSIDATKTDASRTWDTVNWNQGKLKQDSSFLTITSLNLPAQASEAIQAVTDVGPAA